MGAARRQKGSVAVETLIALPLMLLVAGLLAQWILMYQGRHIVHAAVFETVRQGAVAHAAPDAMARGLARGLVPLLGGVESMAGLPVAVLRARAHVELGLRMGWVRWRQISPSLGSFRDWSEPARDPLGETIAGMREIPNDHLDSRTARDRPASGLMMHSRQWREPVGSASRQSLVDANLLKVELVYGLEPRIPIAGTLIVHLMRLVNGCAAGPEAGVLAGSVGQNPALASPVQRVRFDPELCPILLQGRLPVRASAMTRMMSPARMPQSGRLSIPMAP